MTTQELKELWYNDGDMTMEKFIEVVKADERLKVLYDIELLIREYKKEQK